MLLHYLRSGCLVDKISWQVVTNMESYLPVPFQYLDVVLFCHYCDNSIFYNFWTCFTQNGNKSNKCWDHPVTNKVSFFVSTKCFPYYTVLIKALHQNWEPWTFWIFWRRIFIKVYFCSVVSVWWLPPPYSALKLFDCASSSQECILHFSFRF